MEKDKFFDKIIEFEDVIKGDGNGYIYDCDIDLWLGRIIPMDDREKIKKALYQIKGGVNDKC